MLISLYCRNLECPLNKKLEEPIKFKFSQIYTPFEGDECKGLCGSKGYCFAYYDEEIKDFKYEGAICANDGEENTVSLCERADCVHNEKSSCTRPEILIDNLNGQWACKCFSFRNIRGHRDWSSLLTPDQRPKGGHIDDEYANKIHADRQKTHSYRTHMNQRP